MFYLVFLPLSICVALFTKKPYKLQPKREYVLIILKELLAGGGRRGAVGPSVGAVHRVPRVVAVLPKQLTPKRAEHVVQCPRDYYIIVCAHDERDGHRCHANTW